MAKRTTPRSQSQADDGAGAAAAPPARARRSRTAGSESSESLVAEIGSGDAAAVDTLRPREEDIRLRAYQRFLERGGRHGLDFEDWLEAERELRIKK